MSVNVRTIQRYRRKLHFDDYQALLAEARRLVTLADARGEALRIPGQYGLSDRDGRPLPPLAGVEHLANLNLGQTLKHLALWMDASIDGTPMEPPPALIRFVARLLRQKFLSEPVMPGYKLSSRGESHFIPPEHTSPKEGLRALEAAMARLAREEKRAPSLLLGRLSAAQWDRLHLRHAELHLSYLLPREA